MSVAYNSSASEARIVQGAPDSSDHLTIVTAPGKVTVTNPPTDAALTVSGPPVCVLDNPHKVTCTGTVPSPVTTYLADLSVLADTATVSGPLRGSLFGGPGNDKLTGGGGREFMTGDGGVDELYGAGGDDRLVPGGGTGSGGGEVADGGPGDDLIQVGLGEGSGDKVIGGAGTDQFTVVSATGAATTAFSVNLVAGVFSQPAPPDTDSVSGIEELSTMQGADTITGTPGAELIESAADHYYDIVGSGAVTLPPDAGDLVDPGGGPDAVFTFAGNDTVRANDGFGDTINCGAGTDTAQTDRFDRTTDCEAVTVGRDTAAARCRISGVKSTVSTTSFFRGFGVKVGCNESARLRVQAIARVKRAGKVVTSAVGELVVAEKSIGPGTGTRNVKLRGSSKLRRSLGRRFKIRLRVESTDTAGNRAAVTKRITIKKPKPRKKRK